MGKNKKKRRFEEVDEDDGPQIRKNPRTREELPSGIFHYKKISEVPWDIQSYWRQRNMIFSKYDKDIWMTDEAWYGVTQESVATRIAEHVASSAPPARSIILDPFCGAGGNTIAFALSGRWKRVYAIEKDPATLACAMQNARVYGVDDQITWFEGDCFELLGLEKTEPSKEVGVLKAVIEQYGVVFASPPWGGPGYKSEQIFNLEKMQPYSLQYIFEQFKKIASNMVLYLPRTSDLRQIAQCVGKDEKAQVVHYCTSGASRALCAYLGQWATVATKSK